MPRQFNSLLIFTLLLAQPITVGDVSPLKASEMRVCQEIVERSCRGAAINFGPKTASVAFLTRIEGATGDAYVEHVWRFEKEIVRRARVNIKPGSYRAWSTKRIEARLGRWRVEVLDPVGRSLGKMEFTVGAKSEAETE